jgi:hypothetical protein
MTGKEPPTSRVAEVFFVIYFLCLQQGIYKPIQLEVLRIRIRDPVLFCHLDPGSGTGFSRIPDPKLIFLRAR